MQQTYLDSHAQAEYLEAEYRRQKALSAEQAASQKKFQQSKADYLSMKSRMEAAAAQLELLGVNPATLLDGGIRPYLQVKAPIAGYVADVEMNVGNVNINQRQPRMYALASSAKMEMADGGAVANDMAGETEISVNVSGSIQLQ